MPRVFISHAAKDEALVEEIVDLLDGGIGLHPDDIFCSSLPGMGIPTGEDFVAYIKSQVTNPEVVLLVLSQEFFKSQFCNNEVGASWALDLSVYPLLVPPVGYGDLRGVLSGKQAAKLDDKEKLNDLRDDLTERLSLKPLRTSHWERKRDKFLSKLGDFLAPLAAPATPVASPPPVSSAKPVVTTSGLWLKLHDRLYETRRVERHGKQVISVEIVSCSGEEEAALDRLRPPRHGRGPEIGYAYQNDGGHVQVEKVSSTSQAGKNVWSLELKLAEDRRSILSDEVTYNMDGRSYTPDDVAELRAGRLLINNPPPRKARRGMLDDHFESMIFGSGDSGSSVAECVVRQVVAQHRGDLQKACCIARLEAVFRLKAAHIVESIFELALGPLERNSLHVKFRGQRRRMYENVEPEIITVEGDCELG